MRSRDKKLRWLVVAKSLADMGAGLGAGGPGGAWGQNLQGSISNLASSIEQEKAEEEAKKKNSGFGSLGGLLGGVVGNAILPGVGGAIGGALGSAGGQAAGGGDVNFGQVVSSGLGGYMGGGGLKAGADVATTGTQAASNATKQATTTAATKTASDLTQGTFGSITAPVGTGTVLSPAASPPPQNVILGNMQKMTTPPPPSPIRPSFSGSSPLTPATTTPVIAPSQMPEKPGFWQRAGDAALPILYANSLISSYVNGGGGYPGQTPLGGLATQPTRRRNVYDPENNMWAEW